MKVFAFQDDNLSGNVEFELELGVGMGEEVGAKESNTQARDKGLNEVIMDKTGKPVGDRTPIKLSTK